MHQGYQALTDKEKDALRLLLDGHDAKSMARQLGLSVHTINERLRDARRKLGVSSSRAAARELRVIEGATPQLLGDKGLGAAPDAPLPDHIADQPQGRRAVRRAGWLAGGLIMSLVLALYALSALSGAGDAVIAPPAPPPAASAAEQAAIAAARDWLALVDARDWNASWKATGKSFRQLNTPARWAQAAQRVHAPLGALVSREVVTVDFAPAPPNGYWIVRFRSRYSVRGDVVEILSLGWEQGRWKVTGITVD